MPDGRENIPHLLKDFIPQGTIFTQVVNRGILGHYVATASLVTGCYETFNNFAAVSPDNPTVFEDFRKQLHRPASDAWVVAPSNGFGLIGREQPFLAWCRIRRRSDSSQAPFSRGHAG